jgi:hypothetical protein
MLQTTNLIELLENATTQEEEVFDVRFEEIVSLVEQEKLEEASTLITEVFIEGVIDIRLVMYQLYAAFITQGIGCLREVFSTITSVISDHWEKISPLNLRDKYLVHSLTWFLSTISKKIKRSEKLYKDKKPDSFWKKSVSSLKSHEIDPLLEMNHMFSDLLIQKVDNPSLNQYIMFISKWLEGLKAVLSDEKIGVKPTSPQTTSSQITGEKPAKKEISLQEAINASEPMHLLYRKIQAFEALIQQKKFEKAAVVSDDISQTLKNFDPALFFPKLFTQYFALSASHIDALSDRWENKGSLKWDALQRLYQADLDEFVTW